MAYSKQDIDNIFEKICQRIENEEYLGRILKNKGMPAPETFYKWLEDESKAKRYARAKEIHADKIFESMDEVATNRKNDTQAFVGGNHIQRDRLIIDTRKWILAKMLPKKYGDRVDVDHSGSVNLNHSSVKWGENEIKI